MSKLSLIILLFIFNELGAQTFFLINNFNLVNIDSKVEVNWTITAGNTCDGITIYRSTDSVNFEIIEVILGICGSTFEKQSFNYIDEKPIYNKINYYRLRFGGYAATETKSIKVIDFTQTDFYIEPHPIINNSILYFDNPTKLKAILSIYDINGKMIHEVQNENNYFQLSSNQFGTGLYFFHIKLENNKTINGKFIIE